MKNLVWVLAAAVLILGTTPLYAESKSVTVDVSATIVPMVEISVSGPNGGNIEFGMVNKSADGDVTQEAPEVIIKTQSNLYRPYQITQKLITPLANENGDQISPEDFTVQSVTSIEDGRSAVGSSVSTQDSSLFTSNDEGKSNTLRAVYRLKVKPEQAAGTYQSRLVYTIVTL